MHRKAFILLILLISGTISALASPCQDTVVYEQYEFQDSIEYRGTWYYETTSLSFVAQTQEGCDSITMVTLKLVVPPPPPPPVIDTISHGVLVNKYDWILLVNHKVLKTIVAPTPDEYLWFHEEELIPDATEDHYSTTEPLSGFYKVRIRVGETWYTDTITVATRPVAKVSAYPNPAPAGQQVQMSVPGHFSYRIFSQSALPIHHGEGEEQTMLPALTEGIYLVEVTDDEQKLQTLKLIIR